MRQLLCFFTLLSVAGAVWSAPPPPSPVVTTTQSGDTVWLVNVAVCLEDWWVTAAAYDHEKAACADSAESAEVLRSVTCDSGHVTSSKPIYPVRKDVSGYPTWARRSASGDFIATERHVGTSPPWEDMAGELPESGLPLLAGQ